MNVFFSSDRDHSDFEDMQANLNNPQIVKSYKPFKLLPAPGEIVIVKSWDKQWYRALVRELTTSCTADDVDIQVNWLILEE